MREPIISRGRRTLFQRACLLLPYDGTLKRKSIWPMQNAHLLQTVLLTSPPFLNNSETNFCTKFTTPPSSGHPGITTTVQLLKNRFWLPSMTRDTAIFVNTAQHVVRPNPLATFRQGFSNSSLCPNARGPTSP